MPIIAVFFGIVIRMFYKEHEPAHFHAEYQGQQAKFDFSGSVVAGQIQSGNGRPADSRMGGTAPGGTGSQLGEYEGGAIARQDSAAGVRRRDDVLAIRGPG